MLLPDPALGELLREALHRNLTWRVIAVCTSAQSLIATLREEPDCGLAILDPWLPDVRGAEVVEQLHQLRPRLPVLVYTSRSDPLTIDILLRAGARGVIEKGGPLSELLEAVPRIARGETVFSASVATVVRDQVSQVVARLTSREHDIGRRLVQGDDVATIAAALQLSPRTVSNTRRRIASKLGIDPKDRRHRPEWLT